MDSPVHMDVLRNMQMMMREVSSSRDVLCGAKTFRQD